MNSIKRFLKDERASAEATSTVVMIAAAGTLLAAGIAAWYYGLTDAFKAGSGKLETLTGNMKDSFPPAE